MVGFIMGGLGNGSIKGSVKDCCTLNVIQLLNFAKKIQHKIYPPFLF